MNPDYPDRPKSDFPLAGTPHTRVGEDQRIEEVNSQRMLTPQLEPLTLAAILDEFGIDPILQGEKESYQILGYISHSPQAAVFYGRGLRSNREVAIKKVSNREQLEQEKYIQGLLKSRGVTLKSKGGNRQILLADEFLDEPAVVVTRYFKFGDLREFIKTSYKAESTPGEEDFPPRVIIPTPYQTRALIHGACTGLQYVHDCNVVLRDVKSRNMVLDANPALKKLALENLHRVTLRFLDFETGYDMISGHGYVPKKMVGTTYYMSPEAIRGKRQTPQSDIYSLGAVIYEVLTGKRPFEEEETVVEAVFQKHLHERVPDMIQSNPAVGKDLQRLVEKAMAKDPRNRHQTAAELWRHYAMLLR
ncbi:MAG TPA: serine/threonine-protein kinase [Candidatus Nanoarchaeia archaeon]|nr:serine/threonine-protein kinase [Candidatus Nanoarchaeia archaeon]